MEISKEEAENSLEESARTLSAPEIIVRAGMSSAFYMGGAAVAQAVLNALMEIVTTRKEKAGRSEMELAIEISDALKDISSRLSEKAHASLK